jgi:DDE superfamily endonuclease
MNMISTVTNQGKVRFMIFRGIMHAQRLFQFFNQLIKTANKKIFLIIDNLRIHHAKLVKKWLAKKFMHRKLKSSFS